MGFRRKPNRFNISVKAVKNRLNIFQLLNNDEAHVDKLLWVHQGLIFDKDDFQPDAWAYLVERSPHGEKYKKVRDTLSSLGD